MQVPVEVKTTYGLAQRGKTSNLSESGMFVELESVPSVGSEVTVVFASVGRESTPVRVVARVAWTSLTGRKGVGLRIDANATAASHWARYRTLLQHYLGGGQLPTEHARR